MSGQKTVRGGKSEGRSKEAAGAEQKKRVSECGAQGKFAGKVKKSRVRGGGR